MEWSCHYCLFSQEQYKLAHFSHHLWKRGDPSFQTCAGRFYAFYFCWISSSYFPPPVHICFAFHVDFECDNHQYQSPKRTESLSVPLLEELPVDSAIFDILFDRHQSYDRVECHMVQIREGKRLFPPWFKYIAQFLLLLEFFFYKRASDFDYCSSC